MAERPDAPEDPLDGYFDRLDAAFAALHTAASSTPPEAPRDLTAQDERSEVPTVDGLLGDITPARAPGPPESASAPLAAQSLIAQAFTALLAVEQGEAGARPVRLTSSGDELAVTDALVADLTRRVVERLAPDAVREVVAQVVSEVAERLVREEIERIRNK